MRFFHTLIGSFYSADSYRLVKADRGHGLAYSFLLLLLCSCVYTAFFIVMLHRFFFTTYFTPKPLFNDMVDQVVKQLPLMTLKNRQLMTQTPGAYTIYLDATIQNERLHGAVATIDTTGATMVENKTTDFLVTSHEIIFQHKEEPKRETFEELLQGTNPTLIINQSVAHDLGEQFKTFVMENRPKIYFLLALMSVMGLMVVGYIGRLFILLALSGCGLLIAKLLKTPLSFEAAMRMASVAMTPVTVLAVVEMLVMTDLKGFFLSSLSLFLCGLVMLCAALDVSRDVPLAAAP